MAQNSAINMASPVNWAHPLNRGLFGWWLVMPGTSSGSRFTDLTDPGPSGRHGTLTNMDNSDWVGSNRPGGWGALELDGNTESINVGKLVKWQDAVHATLSGWVFRPATGSRQSIGQITEPYRMEWDWFTDDKIYITIENGGSASFPHMGEHTVIGWHHILIAWDGSQSAGVSRITDAVFDGVKQTVTAGGASPASQLASAANQPEFNIGLIGIAYSTGSFDDIRVYDRTLSLSEARQLFQPSQGYPGLLNRIPRRFVAAAAGLDPDQIMAAIRPASQPILQPTGVVPY